MTSEFGKHNIKKGSYIYGVLRGTGAQKSCLVKCVPRVGHGGAFHPVGGDEEGLKGCVYRWRLNYNPFCGFRYRVSLEFILDHWAWSGKGERPRPRAGTDGSRLGRGRRRR